MRHSAGDEGGVAIVGVVFNVTDCGRIEKASVEQPCSAGVALSVARQSTFLYALGTVKLMVFRPASGGAVGETAVANVNV